jgi:ribosomal protein S18 acetylase RimI-like enzyme
VLCLVKLLVTYLEMTEAPKGPAVASPDPAAYVARESLAPADYLELYCAVGTPVRWDTRLRQTPDALADLLRSTRFDLFVLRVEGRALGLCEFDRRDFPEIELAHYGLVPDAQGRGLGRFLLDHCMRAAWQKRPSRIWLHTDGDDDPRALALYRRVGFREYLRRVEEFPDDLAGSSPR